MISAACYLVLAVILPMLTLLSTAIRPYPYISKISQLFAPRTVDVSNLINTLTAEMTPMSWSGRKSRQGYGQISKSDRTHVRGAFFKAA